MNVKVKLDRGAYMPEKAHKLDAGFDIRTPYGFEIAPGEAYIVDTGVHMQIPEGYVGFLKSKSGLNVKYGITGEGVIDAGYEGSIVAKLYRSRTSINGASIFDKGDKIIQIVILPIPEVELEQVEELEPSERGSKGFGSTGR